MTDRWSESLSDYLDGELTPEDRRDLGLHLEGCAECAATLAELERVVEQARTLPDQSPAHDLWPAIEARLGARHVAAPESEPVAGPGARIAQPAKRPRLHVVSFTWPQLVAAGLAIALLSTAAFWLGTRGDQRLVRTVPAPASPGTTVARQEETSEAEIAKLKDALERDRDKLDPVTVKVLEQNLATIERSIREAKAALDADPNNPYLRRHLQETMTRKLNLMRQATFLASAP